MAFPGICRPTEGKNSIGFSSNLKMEMISLVAQKMGGRGRDDGGGGGNSWKGWGIFLNPLLATNGDKSLDVFRLSQRGDQIA